MNVFARSLAVLGVAGHVALSITNAYAYGGGVPGVPLRASVAAAQLDDDAPGLILAAAAAGAGSAGSAGSGAAGAGSAGSAGSGAAGAGAAGGGTGGGAGSGGTHNGAAQPFSQPAAACSTSLQLSDPGDYATPVEGLAAVSEQAQTYIAQCGCNTQACIADALDRYADAVEKVTPRLAPAARAALRKLPAIIHAAASRARVAPTVRAAVKELRTAVATVHKTIALMRASDPDSKSVATRSGDLVEATLKTAATALARADTL